MGQRHSGHERTQADFYVEEEWAACALFGYLKSNHIIRPGTYTVLDPACGTGNVVRAAQSAGFHAVGTDLHERGFGEACTDFLGVDYPYTGFDAIVCNPPFNRWEEFVEAALQDGARDVIMFGQLAKLSSDRRRPLLLDERFYAVYVHSDRVRLHPNGAPIQGSGPSETHAWFHWRRGHIGGAKVGFLSKHDL